MSDDRPLLSAAEVAERLNIGTRTVWKMLKAGDIPSIKVGQLRRVRPADLDAYVAQPPNNQVGGST